MQPFATAACALGTIPAPGARSVGDEVGMDMVNDEFDGGEGLFFSRRAEGVWRAGLGAGVPLGRLRGGDRR